MDAKDIEKTIRDLNGCIINPNERMSEAAIHLMVKLVEGTIAATENALREVLMERAKQ